MCVLYPKRHCSMSGSTLGRDKALDHARSSFSVGCGVGLRALSLRPGFEQHNGIQVTVSIRAGAGEYRSVGGGGPFGEDAESESRGNVEFNSSSKPRSKLDWPGRGSGLCAPRSASSDEWRRRVSHVRFYGNWRNGSLDLLACLVRLCASGLSQLAAQPDEHQASPGRP